MLSPHNLKKWMRGHGYVTGASQLLTSLRAEHSGTIAVLLVLHMLSIRWSLDKTTHPGTILVDHKEVIIRMKDDLPGLSSKCHLIPEYELWTEAIKLTQNLPFSVKWQ